MMSLLPQDPFRALDAVGLVHWRDELRPLVRKRLSDEAHGNLARWRRAVEELPEIEPDSIDLDRDAPAVRADGLTPGVMDQLRSRLFELRPWRKGPFDLFGLRIDAEWRCDLKWDRIANAISPLDGRLVLDVGCGNGYYALRMSATGAAFVLGIDPSPLYVAQFSAIQKYVRRDSVHVLPLRLEDLPESGASFDTVFSMGVLYHRREPLEHLELLRRFLRPGGELVLETLIAPGSRAEVLVPDGRYARMRNVWHLPTLPQLEAWVSAAGFRDGRVADVTATSTDEQRSTEWMPFESLDKALDPHEPTRTIEGLPAPTRAVLICISRS